MFGKTRMSNPLFSAPENGKIAYGCVFCISGKELYVACQLERLTDCIRARAVCQTKRYTIRGKTTLKNVVVFPGYVLFEAPESCDIFRFTQDDESLSVLTYTDGDWRLYGDDRTYAQWVFQYNGLIGLSKGYQIGDRVQIIDGPLKDIEGCITRIDRRNRSGQVTLRFGGRELKVWLGFEIIKEYSVNERSLASGDR